MSKFCYQAVSEETLYIDLPGTDGLKIKGILRGSLEEPLVVMMHGLTGDGNELLQFLGARYLYEQGFSSLRLSMYDYEPTTRNLVDCTLQTHADDFDTVIKYLRAKNVPQLFAAGHSYGGITVLLAKSKLDGTVLWDPTHGLAFQDPQVLKAQKLANSRKLEDMTICLDGHGYIIPKSVEQEQQHLGDTTKWAARKGYPLKVISAGQGVMVELGKRYIDVADKPKEQVVIPEAHHQLEDSDEVIQKLFKETSDWFQEILDGKH